MAVGKVLEAAPALALAISVGILPVDDGPALGPVGEMAALVVGLEKSLTLSLSISSADSAPLAVRLETSTVST